MGVVEKIDHLPHRLATNAVGRKKKELVLGKYPFLHVGVHCRLPT